MSAETKELKTIESDASNQAMTPAKLLEIAVSKDADIDKLEKLMALQERWEATEAKKSYVTAMSLFRAECPTIARTRPGHNNKYAGLAETIEEIKELMSQNGLSHSWKVEQNEQLISVTCHITHNGGHSESSTMSAAPDDSGKKNDIQAIGSTVSYLERYTFYALLGLASREMDDDGAGAPPEYITEEQIANLQDLIDEVGASKEGFLKVVKAESMETILASMYQGAVKRLEAKR